MHLGTLVLALATAATAGAQEGPGAGGGAATPSPAVSPDSADAIRAGLERPRADHPVDAGDVVAFPLRVAAFPVALAFDGVAELLGFVGHPDRWRTLVATYEAIGRLGLRPQVGTDLGPRSGFGLGMRYVGLSPLVLEAAGSFRRYQRYRAGLEWVGDRWSAGVGGGWRRFAQEHFWGIGPGSPEERRADFRWDRTWADARASFRPSEVLLLGVDAAYEENAVGPGGDDGVPDLIRAFDPESLTGADREPRYVRLGVEGGVDLTSWQDLQIRGLRAGARIRRYEGVRGTPSSFTHLTGWAHGYAPLNDRQYLATRVRVETTRGGVRGVPFTHLPFLGGNELLRSFDWGRFRDHDLLAVTGEWRYEIWRDLRERGRFEGVLFWDEGGVARRLDELGETRSSYGFGLTVAWEERVVGSGWVAFGDEGSRASASFSAPFAIGPGRPR